MALLLRHFWAASFFSSQLSLSPEVGVYKVGLIDEHLVRVWKSGEDVRKKCDLDREGEVLCK